MFTSFTILCKNGINLFFICNKHEISLNKVFVPVYFFIAKFAENKMLLTNSFPFVYLSLLFSKTSSSNFAYPKNFLATANYMTVVIHKSMSLPLHIHNVMKIIRSVIFISLFHLALQLMFTLSIHSVKPQTKTHYKIYLINCAKNSAIRYKQHEHDLINIIGPSITT